MDSNIPKSRILPFIVMDNMHPKYAGNRVPPPMKPVGAKSKPEE